MSEVKTDSLPTERDILETMLNVQEVLGIEALCLFDRKCKAFLDGDVELADEIQREIDAVADRVDGCWHGELDGRFTMAGVDGKPTEFGTCRSCLAVVSVGGAQ